MRFVRAILTVSALALLTGCDSTFSKDADRNKALNDPMNYGPSAQDMMEDDSNEPFPTVTNGDPWGRDDEGLKRDLKSAFGD